MQSRIAVLSLFLLALFFLAGCSSTIPPEELTESSWVLVLYLNEKGDPDMVPQSLHATIAFQKDGRFSGNLGCNDFSGRYRVEGGLITIDQIVPSGKVCQAPEGIMDFEQQYRSLLSDATRYNIDGDELTLSHYDERKLLVFWKI